MNFKAYKPICTLICFLFGCSNALAGFGGMGNVDANDAGSASAASLLIAIAIFGGGGYAAFRYASRFDGNQGYGRIAIGIIALLVLIAVFK
jgi:hypothetical protein